MEIGIVQPVDIEREMRSTYLDYAMSVNAIKTGIVAEAIEMEVKVDGR